ncbi:hypothetical protein GMST_30420 [Geomonas silvestris]|uniref:Bacterial repeat domain-containing protein n=1 Tax=Geomonas silvestris TaxID=2740184 RepID=A0A6V8MLI4_9BACT|nr:kelch repeat-containing protein [Geomonas silvestris]GFO60717.1 hypothetical protein GMST_30420 [Geomonas silvestris]
MHNHGSCNARRPKGSQWWFSTIMRLAALLVLAACLVPVSEATAKNFAPQPSVTATRYANTITLLPNGLVLIAGGYDNTNCLNTVDIYDPATGNVSAGRKMNAARMEHTATLLGNGKVLIAGGRNGTAAVNSAEIYDPANGTFTPVTAPTLGRVGHSATLLPDGRVLLAGGTNNNKYIATAEIYDPQKGSITQVASLNAPRSGHTATLLRTGKVLLVGGMNGASYTGDAEIYDPSTGKFSVAGRLNVNRIAHTTSLLEDGRLLVTGGRNESGIVGSAEAFDPATGSFSSVGNMASVRADHTSTLMPDGAVLIAGGRNALGYLNSAEVYYPETAAFTPTVNMTTVRDISSAVLLPNGKVLVAGGWDGTSAASGAEIFDPELVQAKYRLHLVTLSNNTDVVNFTPGQSCSGGCVQFFPGGTQVRLTPAPAPDSTFVGWSGCDAVQGSDCIVTMSRDHLVKLKTTKSDTGNSDVSYPVVALAGPHGTIAPAGITMVDRGQNISFSITPASGYHIADVLVDGDNSMGAISSFTFTNVKKAHAIAAIFALNDAITITASADANGTIAPAGATVLAIGASQSYTITPAAGFKVADVLVDNVSVGAVTSYTFSDVGSDHTISASFTPNIYSITATAGANGSISPAGVSTVNQGNGQNYSITPAAGFQVADVLVDGASVGAVTSYSFSNVTANHTIAASFAPIVYQISASAGANGSITPVGVTNVNSGADQSFTITAAANFKIADVLVDGVSVGAVASYSFTNVTANHTIAATFTPIVHVITASAGANGSITPAGATSVNSGTDQSFAVTAAPNYKIADLLVDGVSVGPLASYSFTKVTANHTIAASFAPIVYVITANAGANGSITPAGPSNVNSGSALSYSITPAANFRVADVLVDGTSVGPVTSYSFKSVTMDHTITASFTPVVFVITASAGANGGIDNAGPVNVNSGSSQTYSITAAPNYKVADVQVDGVSVGAVSSYSFSDVTANHTITATFTPIVYVVTASAGANGSIDPAGPVNVNSGTGQSFSIAAAPNYKVADVVVDGASAGPVSSYSFANVTADHTITASFTPIVYVVSASAGANGSITPAGPCNVNSGTGQTYTITAAVNYKIADVQVDGVSVGAVASYSFSNVTANHSIAATFTPIVHVITASAGANGSIDPAGPVNVNGGSSQSYTISAAPNYKIADVLVDGVSVGPEASYSFANVTGDHTITATFTPIVYVVSASAGANGSITPAGASNVNSGTGLSYSIVPAANYKIAEVVVDGVSVGAVASYSFSNVTANHTITATFTPIVYAVTATSGVNGSITPAGASNVNSGAGLSYSITAAPNYKIADVLVDGVSVGAVASYSFSNVTANHTIAASFAPIVYVINASAGANGSIDPAGPVNVNSGTSQSYSITAAANYKIADVLVDGVSVGAVPNYSFNNVTGNHTIAASFTPIVYLVSANAGANGSISPAGVTSVNSGSELRYTITPNRGATPLDSYKVADVLVDGTSVGAVTSYSFSNVTANHNITASFAPLAESVDYYIVSASAGVGGSISASGETVLFPGENSPVYAIAPSTGYQIAQVLVDGQPMGKITSYSFAAVSANHTITASFTPIRFDLSASAGANGSVTPAGVTGVDYGTGQSYVITPATGFKVADVLVDGSSVGAVSSYRFNSVTANHSISATFTPIVYLLNASAGANGSIAPAGQLSVNYGTSQAYVITPATGFKVADVQLDGTSVGAVTGYTLSEVTANHSIAATFTPIEYLINASAGPNGSITPQGPASVNYGTNQSYSIVPAAGYKVADVLVDGVSVGAVTAYNFSGVTGNHAIAASFTQITFDLIATAGANGSITPAGVTSVVTGARQTYSITPAAGFKVADVLVDGVSVGKVTSYTFSAVAAGHSIVAAFTPITYDLSASAGTGGSIDPAGITTVNSGAGQTYTITPNAGYKLSDVQVDGVSVGKVTSYSFSSVTANHTISASFAPLVVNVDYFVISVTPPVNGTITPAGDTNVLAGANSPLYTITPAVGYVISSVGDNGALLVRPPAGPYTYTFQNVSKAHVLSASFRQATYAITPVIGANGTMSPSSTVYPTYGANQYCSFTASAGYHVADVLLDGVSLGPVANYTITNITAPHTIEVRFEANVSVTVTASAGDNGSITPAGVTTVLSGTNLTYTMTPAAGYRVADVVVDGVSKGALSSYTFSKISSVNHTISATFTLDVYSITASVGANGSIDRPGVTGNIAPGSTLVYNFTPATGYKVANVVVDGASKGSLTSYTFSSIMANHTIAVSFTPITFTITQSAGVGGTNYPNSVAYVAYGTSATYSIVASPGYHVADVLVDGVSVGAITSYTFTNVLADHSIASVFAENPTVTVTASAGPNGSISPSGAISVLAGKSLTFTMTADPAYRVADIVVDGVSKGPATSYTLSNISATDHTVHVTFMLDAYTIKTSVGPGGSITPSADVSVAKGGDSPVYTVTPATGYQIVTVGDNGKLLAKNPSAPYSTSFTNVTADHTLSASFRLITYTLTPIVGANGSMTPYNPVFPTYGSSYYVAITPNPGYHVADVLVDGVSVGAVTSYTFSNITADHTIESQFAPNPAVTVTATAGPNGTIDPAGVSTAYTGSSLTYTMTPAAGYRVADVLVDGVSKGALTSYTFAKISGTSHTISVTFTPDVYTIVSTNEANGSIDPLGTTMITAGDTITYTITPADGYKVLNVAVDGIYIGPVTSYTFNSVAGDHTITPSFALIQVP